MYFVVAIVSDECAGELSFFHFSQVSLLFGGEVYSKITIPRFSGANRKSKQAQRS